jgi:acyl-CoA reductase-like NAD-dependent aldehyde dehydrogenase
MSDAVIERTAQGIINSFSGCAGERCMALPVVAVEKSIADQLVEAIVRLAKQINLGPAYDKNTGMGPVVNQGHKDFVLNWIETAIKEGAKLILDGRKPKVPQGCEKGYFIGPTIFDHVTEEMSCGREEIFGPVLSVLTFRTPQEAVAKANNTTYGLSAGVWTEKGSRILWMAARLRAGVVWANTFNRFDPASPFGGYRESGFGREGGRHGLGAYLDG